MRRLHSIFEERVEQSEFLLLTLFKAQANPLAQISVIQEEAHWFAINGCYTSIGCKIQQRYNLHRCSSLNVNQPTPFSSKDIGQPFFIHVHLHAGLSVCFSHGIKGERGELSSDDTKYFITIAIQYDAELIT